VGESMTGRKEEKSSLDWRTLPLDPDVADSAISEAHERLWRFSWQEIALVFIGGALGSAGRDALSLHFTPPVGGFPTATVFINISGAFALGVLLGVLLRRGSARSHPLRLLLGTGFLGGWTTYSTFSLQAVDLIRLGRPFAGALSLVLTLLGGALASLCGVGAAMRFVARKEAL